MWVDQVCSKKVGDQLGRAGDVVRLRNQQVERTAAQLTVPTGKPLPSRIAAATQLEVGVFSAFSVA